MSRFSELKPGAFVPFWMLGDPDLETSFERIQVLVDNGADALELGIPFSDPVADGPVVQLAAMRALKAGASLEACFKLLARVRQEYPTIPISILTYSNLAIHLGLEEFYQSCANSGVDAVLLADVPTVEAEVFCQTAMRHGIDPVLIAAPNMSEEQIQQVAQLSKGYVYAVTRAGVTGSDEKLSMSSKHLIEKLASFGAPPVLMGFGISTPEHVQQALEQGAWGAISGSAVISQALTNLDGLGQMIRNMKSLRCGNPSAETYSKLKIQ